MKKNKNNPNYNKLKVTFVKNFNELRQIKRQNEIIRKRMEEASNMLMVKKEDNIHLKNKLHEYQKTTSIMETTKRKRTREEVRAAFREYLKNKKKRMEENQRELEEIHQKIMSGMTMEEIFA